jgi:hypothetical protein
MLQEIEPFNINLDFLTFIFALDVDLDVFLQA